MKKSRFSESQIVAILKEADAGFKVQDIWRKYNISSGRTTSENQSTVVWRFPTLRGSRSLRGRSGGLSRCMPMSVLRTVLLRS